MTKYVKTTLAYTSGEGTDRFGRPKEPAPYYAADPKEVMPRLAEIFGFDVGQMYITKDEVKVFKPRQPAKKVAKESAGAAGPVYGLSELTPKARAYVEAMAARIVAGTSTLKDVVPRMYDHVRMLAETLRMEIEDDLDIPGEKDDDLEIPEEKPKARGPKMAGTGPLDNVSKAAQMAAIKRELKRKMSGR